MSTGLEYWSKVDSKEICKVEKKENERRTKIVW
jgi:hypothetical protein